MLIRSVYLVKKDDNPVDSDRHQLDKEWAMSLPLGLARLPGNDAEARVEISFSGAPSFLTGWSLSRVLQHTDYRG